MLVIGCSQPASLEREGYGDGRRDESGMLSFPPRSKFLSGNIVKGETRRRDTWLDPLSPGNPRNEDEGGRAKYEHATAVLSYVVRNLDAVAAQPGGIPNFYRRHSKRGCFLNRALQKKSAPLFLLQKLCF